MPHGNQIKTRRAGCISLLGQLGLLPCVREPRCAAEQREITSLKMFIGISFVSAFIELESTRFSDVFIREGNDDYKSGQRGGNNLHADARQARTASNDHI